MEKKKAVLLDVSAIMYRAYFANMNFRTKNEPYGRGKVWKRQKCGWGGSP